MIHTEKLPSSVMTTVRRTRSLITAMNWGWIPGSAARIAMSPDGSLWALSNATVANTPDHPIWHWANNNWTNVPGAAIRIAVGPDGTPWVVNSAGGIYYFDGANWQGIAGGASDISVAADASVYVISNQPGNQFGNAIWHYSGGASGTWSSLPGAGVHIAANWDTNTYPGGITPGGLWVVNGANAIYYYAPNLNGYVSIVGGAVDLAPTIIGGIFALGTARNPDGSYPIYYYDLSGQTWNGQPGSALNLTSNSSQTVFVVGADNGIYTGPLSTLAGLGGGNGSQYTPAWWSGICDVANHPGSYPLPKGAAPQGYLGIYPCGPRPDYDGGGNTPRIVDGVSLLEWQCVELSMRFMKAVYGVHPYSANGSTIVKNYPANEPPVLLPVTHNDGTGPLPVPGDILEYGPTGYSAAYLDSKCQAATSANGDLPFCGHTSVVISTSITPGGSGQIVVMEQNNSASGTATLDVTNGIVNTKLRPYPVTGWLHQAGTVTTQPSNPMPTVASVSPTSMSANGQQQLLTISGASFAKGDVVQFKWGVGQGANVWTPAQTVPNIASSTQITLGMFPGNVSDTIYVRVCSDGSATSCSDGSAHVAVNAPLGAPTVSSVSPSSMPANGTAQTITIGGSGFAAGDVVQFKWGQGLGAGSWNTSSAQPQVLSANQIAHSMNPGTVADTIYVRVCTDSSATVCSDGTQYVSVTTALASPTVSSLSPTSMTANGQTQTLTINGSSFASGDIVQFKWGQGAGAGTWNTANGTPNIASSSQISIGMNTGTVSDTIYVRVCTSTAAATCSDGTAYVLVTAAALTPTVSSVSPTSMTANGQTQTVTIYGSSFAGGDVVQFRWGQGAGSGTWNTANGTPNIASSSQISIGMNPGTVNDTIYVRVCTSTAATSCSDGSAHVVVTAPAVSPNVSSLSPTSMTANGQTQTLTIYGGSFANGDIVQYKWTQGQGAFVWNTANATPSVVSSSQIVVGMNPGVVNDTINVRVCTNSAATSCSDGSAYVSVVAAALTPSVTSISPTSMSANGQSQAVSIYGSSFAAGDVVQFKWGVGQGANVWNTANSTPTILSSSQINIYMNPGTVSDTIYVRVCSDSTASHCSSGSQYVSVH